MNRVTFVQSFVENWKKKITRREIISNPDISTQRIFRQVCRMRARIN